MDQSIVYPAQMGTQSFGRLQVNAVSVTTQRPIPDATVRIRYTGGPETTVAETTTNVIGQTEEIELPAPSIDYSMEPSAEQPYSEYNIEISAPDFETVEVNAAQILPGVTALQNSELLPAEAQAEETAELFVVLPHTLFYAYPPKIAEAEIKPTNESGEIVLSRVVIPEFVVVHDGPPSDSSAQNYYVRYRDYIKNVASSEIYATWPESTITANVLAIQSFTLNRVYTEWYRNIGRFRIGGNRKTDGLVWNVLFFAERRSRIFLFI